ncbi:hypothetical protein ACQ4PT_055858 [Festuca glaucescens]
MATPPPARSRRRGRRTCGARTPASTSTAPSTPRPSATPSPRRLPESAAATTTSSSSPTRMPSRTTAALRQPRATARALSMAEEAACKRIKTEKELGARPDGAAAAEEGRPDGEISVKINSEALRCRICVEPLKPPIFKLAWLM